MFSIQIKGGAPISEQLEERITELIVTGIMEENEKLPAVREVAKELAINPNTVQKTYQKLEQKGLIYSLPGKGSYVRESGAYMDDIKQEARALFEAAIADAVKHGLTRQELQKLVTDNTKD